MLIPMESDSSPGVPIPIWILHKSRKHLTPRLQQRMSDHDLQKPLQPLPSMLNHIITKPVRKHLPRQRRDSNSGALTLKDIAEIFEVGVTAPYGGGLKLEGRNVGSANNLVVGVHMAAYAVRLRIANLYLKKVFRRAVDLFEGLLARIRHGLHLDGSVFDQRTGRMV